MQSFIVMVRWHDPGALICCRPGDQYIMSSVLLTYRFWFQVEKKIVCKKHILAAGVWSSPALTGTRPCPRSELTLTAINNHQAIGFSGFNGEQGFLNDCFIIDFLKMVSLYYAIVYRLV